VGCRNLPSSAEGQVAEDGRTAIYPEKGIMAGKGITAKNKRNQTKQLVSSLFGVSATKTRWYLLDGKILSWTRMTGGETQEPQERDDNDSVHMSKVRATQDHAVQRLHAHSP
jgi:hypothetical protein